MIMITTTIIDNDSNDGNNINNSNKSLKVGSKFAMKTIVIGTTASALFNGHSSERKCAKIFFKQRNVV